MQDFFCRARMYTMPPDFRQNRRYRLCVARAGGGHMPGSRLGRRDFVRTVTAGLAAAPFFGTREFAQSLIRRRSRVALVRTSDRKHGVNAVLKLLDIRSPAGKRVVL